MAGRGRDLTLPAWMAASNQGPPSQGAPGMPGPPGSMMMRPSAPGMPQGPGQMQNRPGMFMPPQMQQSHAPGGPGMQHGGMQPGGPGGPGPGGPGPGGPGPGPGMMMQHGPGPMMGGPGQPPPPARGNSLPGQMQGPGHMQGPGPGPGGPGPMQGMPGGHMQGPGPGQGPMQGGPQMNMGGPPMPGMGPPGNMGPGPGPYGGNQGPQGMQMPPGHMPPGHMPGPPGPGMHPQGQGMGPGLGPFQGPGGQGPMGGMPQGGPPPNMQGMPGGPGGPQMGGPPMQMHGMPPQPNLAGPPGGPSGPPQGPPMSLAPPGASGPPPSGAPPPGAPIGAGIGLGGDPKNEWTEHADPKSSRKYYYNTRTKASRWEKPEDLMSEQERADASTNWKEYVSPEGRKYYYNKQTKESRWTMPDELKKAREGPKTAPAVTKPSGPSAVQVVSLGPGDGPGAARAEGKRDTPPPQEKSTGNGISVADSAAGEKDEKIAESGLDAKEASSKDMGDSQSEFTEHGASNSKFQYSSKVEAKDAFKELLASVRCASDWTWEQTMRLIISDGRYGALKSLGEKKACFNEYIQQRRNEEKVEERRRAVQAREDFGKMLDESSELKSTTYFSKAQDMFEDDARWKAVPERDRKELYEDHLREREKKEREKRKLEKKRKLQAFRDLLEKSGSIKVSTEYRRMCKKLEGEEAYEALERTERVEAFSDYIKELERREKEKEQKEKEDRLRQERINRDLFRGLLLRHKDEGKITVKSRWKEYGVTVEKEEAYLALMKNKTGSTPKDMFNHLIEELEEEYEREKPLLKDFVKEQEMVVSANMTYEDFASELEKGDDKLKKIHMVFKRTFYEELMGRARAREMEAEKKAKRIRDEFGSLLRHAKRLTTETDWDDFKKDYDKDPAFKAMKEDEAREVFEDYVDKLRRKEEKKRRKDDDEDDEDVKREAKKRRSGDGSEGDEEPRDRKDKEKDKDKKDKDKDKEKKHKDKKEKKHHDDDAEHKSSKRHKKDKEKDREKDSKSRGDGDDTSPDR